MKKDINIIKVKDVAIAIIPSDDEFWEIYLLNLKMNPLKNVIINTTGYGEIDNNPVQTSTLRHFFEEIPANCSIKIELLQNEMIELTNQIWISFQLDDYLFDKKYVFVKGSLSKINFTNIPFLNVKGIMIQ